MVYEQEPSDHNYPTVLDDKTLMNIRANEILRLADDDPDLPPHFKELWRRNITLLNPDEKKYVHDFLVQQSALLSAEKSGLVGKLTRDEIRWYKGQIARLERGAEYLKTNFPDFPSNRK